MDSCSSNIWVRMTCDIEEDGLGFVKMFVGRNIRCTISDDEREIITESMLIPFTDGSVTSVDHGHQ